MALDDLPPAEAVAITLQVFQDNDNSRFWASPLVRVLEKRRPKLALRWAILLFYGTLSARRNTNTNDSADQHTEQLNWLVELDSLIESVSIADYCDATAHTIWSRDGANLLERGIARLFWALENHCIGLIEPDYYLQVTSAVAMLVDASISAGDEGSAIVERGIAIFCDLTGICFLPIDSSRATQQATMFVSTESGYIAGEESRRQDVGGDSERERL